MTAAKSLTAPHGVDAAIPASVLSKITGDAEKQIRTHLRDWIKNAYKGMKSDPQVDIAVSQGKGGALVIQVKSTPQASKPATNTKEAAGETVSIFAEAKARGQAKVAQILAQPDMLTTEAFAELIGVTRQSVNEKRQKFQILGLEGAKRGFKYPIWQIGEDGKPFEALPDLFAELAGPWAVYRFLIQHHPELDGQTGVEALAAGRRDDVIALAANIERSSA